MLRAIRRPIGGDHYKRIEDACRRLKSTYVETNVGGGQTRDGDVEKGGFSWIDRWGSVKKDGKIVSMTITLSDWFYEWVTATGGVLSIHEDYFLLTGGIERWLYRVARKHGGNQDMGWTLTMRQLYEKSGSAARLSDFALDIRKIVAADALPEYALTLGFSERGEESVTMVRRCLLAFTDPRFQPSARRLGNGKPKAAGHAALNRCRTWPIRRKRRPAGIPIPAPRRDYPPDSTAFRAFQAAEAVSTPPFAGGLWICETTWPIRRNPLGRLGAHGIGRSGANDWPIRRTDRQISKRRTKRYVSLNC